MAYNKKKIFEKAKEATAKEKLLFIEDIIAYLPCSKPTFYSFFPPESNEFNALKELLDINRIKLKVLLRRKWSASNAPALQMGLMKLVATPEEAKRLSMQFIESKNENINKNFDITQIYNDDDDDENQETQQGLE